MEGKAVTSAMTPMSRRSREHRSFKNTGPIQEAPSTLSDIASTSKILKVGISSSDTSKRLKDLAGNLSPRRPSRLSQKSNGVHLYQGLDAGAIGTKPYVQGSSTASPGLNFAKPSSNIASGSVAPKVHRNGGVGQGTGSMVPSPHVVNSNGSCPVPERDVADHANGRALRARHVTPFKKTSKRARRFQEVSLSETDGAKILGRRIKVFWPLDNKWFYGEVKAFNRGKRLHKIVYDDQDEEWVKLHKEQFKLQVLEGEVFGSQQRLLARQSADVPGSQSKAAQISGKQIRGTAQEQGSGVNNVATLVNGNIPSPLPIDVSHGSPGPLSGTPPAPEKSIVHNGEVDQQPDPIARKPCDDVGERPNSVQIFTSLSESLDSEDPYALGSTSISDSLDTFRRSKQSLGEARKDLVVKGALENVIGVANPTVVCSSKKSTGHSEGISTVVISDLACISENEKVLLSEEKSGASERISIQDGKIFSISRAAGTLEDNSLLITGESGEVDSPLRIVTVKGESRLGHERESSKTESRHLDDVVQIRGKEKRVRLKSRDNDGIDIPNGMLGLEESQSQPMSERNISREASLSSPIEDTTGSAYWKGFVTRALSISESSGGRIFSDVRQTRCLRLINDWQYISQHIATYLVIVACTMPEQYYPALSFDSDNGWRGVPYLTLFVSFGLEGGVGWKKSWHALLTCCRKEHNGKCSTLQRSAVLDHNLTASEIFLSRSAISELAGHGAWCSPCTISSSQVVPDGRNIYQNVLARPCIVDPPVESMPPTDDLDMDCSGVPVLPQCCEIEFVEKPVPGATVAVPGVPTVEDNSTERNGCEDVETHINGEAFSCGASEGPTCKHRADVFTIRNAGTVSQAENGGTLTEVQIESAGEGGKDSVAVYRGWKSAKRGFLNLAEDDLESSGLGTQRRLLELDCTDLVCISPVKRQKVDEDRYSIADSQMENKEDGEKEMPTPVECDMIGEKNSKSLDSRDCEPRVNVLKLRRCPTNKSVWRVAGNSCSQDRGVKPFSDGGEPLTPSSNADRKRSFRQFRDVYQPGSPEENGQSAMFVEGPYANGHDLSIIQGTDELKVKEIWSNCEVSSIQDVTSNSRKRLRHGSTSSVSSDDAYAPHSRAEETYFNGTPNDHSYSESLCHGCIANVLVVQNDKGWRETGARVDLQFTNGQGWMLVVTVRGENIYAYKAENALATGTTSRYTHAMVWRGGKGWSLEFDDRKQWQVFKDLHEECFRRNARASSVRHIPIPGVKPIEDIAPRSPGCQFTRPYSRYISRVEDEVEMALANSRVVYDMDSEDEQWLAQVNNERASARGTRSRPLIAEETLERLMDKLEKEAFTHQQQHKDVESASSDVAAESCNGLASQEVIKVIYAYWLTKRTRKGMPLVRHFQPPPWEQYQKQLQIWEQELSVLQQQSPMASRQQLMLECRKPPLFAFCLRPRGLEVQHKLLKQRSHRKQQTFSGTASRQWGGSIESSLDSPSKRQFSTEPANGTLLGTRRPGRPRLTEEVIAADLAGSFNAIARESIRSQSAIGLVRGTLVHSELAQRRVRKSKKVGRKARRMRLLAAAQESRRKRLLLCNMSSVKVHQQPDVAVAAVIARSTADAARARAQALYAVADAAMHKAVVAVITANALHSVEQHQALDEDKVALGGDPAGGPSFGSWRRAVSTGAAGSVGARSGSQQGLVNDGEDALLPVASWSEELGAGLGTQLLNKDANMEGIPTRNAHGDSPLVAGGLGRTRGESMMAMLTR